MPTYEYECKNCKKIFELFQRMTEPAIKTCPKCGQPVFRLIGAGGGIIFKGSGFYATDYKKNKVKAKINKREDKTDASDSAPAGNKV